MIYLLICTPINIPFETLFTTFLLLLLLFSWLAPVKTVLRAEPFRTRLRFRTSWIWLFDFWRRFLNDFRYSCLANSVGSIHRTAKCIPVLYAFLPNKGQNTYAILFELLGNGTQHSFFCNKSEVQIWLRSYSNERCACRFPIDSYIYKDVFCIIAGR